MSFLEAIFGIRELGPGDFRLKRGERDLLELGNVTLREPRSVRRCVYGGPSIRVGGIPIRLGAFQAESHEALRDIDRGTLTLTNRRLVFIGDKKSTNYTSTQDHADREWR